MTFIVTNDIDHRYNDILIFIEKVLKLPAEIEFCLDVGQNYMLKIARKLSDVTHI